MIVKNQSMVKRQNCVMWIHVLRTVYIKADNVYGDIFFIEWSLNICVLKYMRLIQQIYFTPGLAWEAALKKNKVKLHLLTDIDILLMVENVREGIWCYIY